jgi:hypothetical protein
MGAEAGIGAGSAVSVRAASVAEVIGLAPAIAR